VRAGEQARRGGRSLDPLAPWRGDKDARNCSAQPVQPEKPRLTRPFEVVSELAAAALVRPRWRATHVLQSGGATRQSVVSRTSP
jgi:hypothetical protein